MAILNSVLGCAGKENSMTRCIFVVPAPGTLSYYGIATSLSLPSGSTGGGSINAGDGAGTGASFGFTFGREHWRRRGRNEFFGGDQSFYRVSGPMTG